MCILFRELKQLRKVVPNMPALLGQFTIQRSYCVDFLP
jgi:hypothetical protein